MENLMEDLVVIFLNLITIKSDIFWMIPISSKVEKYKEQYQHSIEKYKMCEQYIILLCSW